MKILVVDNNPVVLRVLTEFLSGELGHEVRTANDGLGALHLLDDFLPEVVITDLVMPNIGGDKLCRIIRDTPHLNHCFLIILSAIAAEEKDEKKQACGADACVAKGKTVDVKEHLRQLLAGAGEHKSDTLYEVDLTVGLEQVHNREVTRELLNSRDYFAGIVEFLDDGVFGLSHDDHIIYANRAAAELAGISEEKLLGREFTALFADNERATIRRGLREAQQQNSRQAQTIDYDPPLSLNGNFIALRCLPVAVDQQRAVVVLMQDQSARVLERLTPRD
ncbi:MAG: response regulator [Desulfurivibrio sp.]|nr:response regulator [Desulfurivibrio sp.]